MACVQRFEGWFDLAALAQDFTTGAKGARAIGIPGDDRIDFGQSLGGLPGMYRAQRPG